jgi:hypothetical protein
MKMLKLFAQQHGGTSQETCIITSTAVTLSHLTLCYSVRRINPQDVFMLWTVVITIEMVTEFFS